VSRLDYAPKVNEVRITDIKKGLGEFAPKPDRPVSFAALKGALKKAGYALDSAEITVTGRLADGGRALVVEPSGQRFALEGADIDKALEGAADGSRVEVTGTWKSGGEGRAAREVISPRQVKKAEGPSTARAAPTVKFAAASFGGSLYGDASTSPALPAPEPRAPIRTTTPGLTVYKGGAFVPRLYFSRQSLGGLDVTRQRLQLSASYTPSPRLQLEAEVPISRTEFDDGANSGSGFGLGNVTLWGKYRFYRSVSQWGDRQAAARFGLELPTGRSDAPGADRVNAPAFVRQQLTPISGGTSARLDLSYSQARKRFIMGGNVEGVLRSERDGFRMGHELRVNTDLEYIVLPRKYESPGGELFLILETTFVQRGLGRLEGREVPGSRSTEYYLAPGLQYAAAPRWVVEGSYQFPVVDNMGPLVLRNGGNLLLGIRYLY
jgi:hypothetical protein